MITIVDWNDFEVNAKGSQWRDGDKLRIGPLEYIRVKCHGRSWGEKWRDLLSASTEHSAMALGVYVKLLEIIGSDPENLRDCVRTKKGNCASEEDISRMTGFPISVVTVSITTLCVAGWITSSEISRNSQDSGKSRLLLEASKASKDKTNIPENPKSETLPGVSEPTKADRDAAFDAQWPVDCPTLSEYHHKIYAWIWADHQSFKVPKKGSSARRNDLRVLHSLVTKDGLGEEDIMNGLEWAFERQENNNGFMWKEQVRCIKTLRQRVKSGAYKMAAIIDAWKRAEPNK